MNIKRDSNRPRIIYKLLDSFKILGYIIEINRALYKL
jgi:hypothetical protein